MEAVTHTLAKYVMELSLCDYSLVAEPPSRLAAAALALSIRLLEPGLSSGSQCCGSGSGFTIGIQIQEGKNDPQHIGKSY